MKRNDALSAKERRFCSFYISSGDFREAAALAGFADPVKDGAALLTKDKINLEIERLYQTRSENCRRQARAGYERLAFGNVSDAVRLMFAQDPDAEQLRGLDLFNVAEIKRPKDGALEIRFFDRIKALEKLESAETEEKNRVSDFYTALVGSIADNSGEQESSI